MSGYSYILPTESPPSLDTSDEKMETPDSLPMTPSSPSDVDDFERQSKNPLNVPFEENIESNSLVIDNAKNEKQLPSSPIDDTTSSIKDDNRNKTFSNNVNTLDCIKTDDRVNDDNIINSNGSVNKNKCLSLKSNGIKDSPKLISTLTLTEDHPLMVLSSPDSPPSTGNYPNLILLSCKDSVQNGHKIIDSNHLHSECSGVVSFSSTEDESFNKSLTNGDHSESFPILCEPQRNTSKNNLYFSENFISSECSRNEDGCCIENVTKCRSVDECQTIILLNKQSNKFTNNIITNNTKNKTERKKIKPDFKAPKCNNISIISNCPLNSDQSLAQKVADFPESPSDLRASLKYDLPIELPSSIETDDLNSPDSSTASKPENEHSLYQAEVDPYEGCVVLKPRVHAPPVITTRKRIKPLPNETDTESTALSNQGLFTSCRNEVLDSASSLESLSDCSLHSDDGDNMRIFHNPTNCMNIGRHDDLNEYSDTETDTEGLRSKTICEDIPSDNIEKIPEYSLSEERRDARLWHKVTLPNGEQRTIDMKVIEPYKRVLSHGGYALSGRRDAIVVFSACYLPDSSRVDYNYVMDNLFLYVLTTLEQLVTDDYILIYLHGSASKRSMPTFHWLKKCYQLIDRRLRKSLKHLYLVHPTFWLKSIMWMTRPFISSKFSRKLSYVYNLDELENLVPVEQAAIPERVRRYDSTRT